MGQLDGKVAIVTGGAGGIGASVCRAYAREGATVVVADVDHDAASAVAAEIGGAATAAFYDASDADVVRSVIDETVAREGHLDVLHNNHALTSMMPVDTGAVSIDLDVWDRIMAVNLRGYLLGCRFALPHLAATGSASVINTSSVAGLRGSAARLAYSTSKAGIIALTRGIAAEFGKRGVRANAIAPGLILTPMLEAVEGDIAGPTIAASAIKRAGRPADVAELACFLASDASSFITGQVIVIDGGLTMMG